MNIRNFLFYFLITASLFSCSEDDSENLSVNTNSNTTGVETEGTLQLEVTDAPVDDGQVSAVFITFTSIKANGETISNFSGSKTVDILAYQNGRTELIGDSKVKTGTYSQIELVLDYTSNADNSAPGCYVLTNDNQIFDLNTSGKSTESVLLNFNQVELEENSTAKFVLDFDLRKSIKKNATKEYYLSSGDDLGKDLRLVRKEKTGTIKGKVESSTLSGDKTLVFAYTKGTYNTSEFESNDEQFSNAVTSTSVAADGTYQLSFLEEGEYEVVYCSYEKDQNDEDESYKLKGTLSVNSQLGLNTKSIQVNAESQVTLDVVITSLIDI